MSFEISNYDFSKLPGFLKIVAKCNNFDDIYGFLEKKDNKFKGDFFELLTCCMSYNKNKLSEDCVKLLETVNSWQWK